jgi:hypothetical protein
VANQKPKKKKKKKKNKKKNAGLKRSHDKHTNTWDLFHSSSNLEVVQRLVDLLEFKKDIAAVSLQRDQVHVSAKILRVDPRQRQSRR